MVGRPYSWTSHRAAKIAFALCFVIALLGAAGTALVPDLLHSDAPFWWLVACITLPSIYAGVFTSALFRLSVGLQVILAVFALIPAYAVVNTALAFAGCSAGFGLLSESI